MRLRPWMAVFWYCFLRNSSSWRNSSLVASAALVRAIGKFVGEAYFTVAGGEDEVFAGKVQVCGQGGKFSFHGFAVDLDQELVTRAQGLV